MPKTKGAPKVQGPVSGKRPASGPRVAHDPGDSRRALWWVTGALVVALLVIVFLLAREAGFGQDPFERRVEELRAEEARRDREQIGELTELARDARDLVVPHLDEFSQAVPVGSDVTTVDVEIEEIEAWQETLSEASALFEESPSGTTATNIARHSLGMSLGLLESAVDLFAIAAVAEGDLQADLVERASVQRDLAVQTWSVGATQLDAINIDAGYGHQHVYLEIEGLEMMSPDELQDGDEAVG